MQPVSLNTSLRSPSISAGRLGTSENRGAGDAGAARPSGDGSAANDPVGGAALAGVSGETISVVNSRVDTMLASFGGEMAADQQLRMIIALLILNALLGGGDSQPSQASDRSIELMAGLEALGRRSDVAQFSATNIIQIRHQSTLVYTEQAVQTTTRAADQTGRPNAGEPDGPNAGASDNSNARPSAGPSTYAPDGASAGPRDVSNPGQTTQTRLDVQA